jgi:hypothetical protein
MKILLINSNPVVSRLTALSARKEEIQIDEVQEINEVSNRKYDIVFVDADSWSKELDSAISKDIQTQKRVLFYAQDDKNNKELFDISILKPFLPSEVSAVIRSVEEYALSTKDTSESLVELEEESIFHELETENSKDEKKKEEKKEEKNEDFLLSLDDDVLVDEKELTTVDKTENENLKKETTLDVKEMDKEEDLFAELKENSNDFNQQLEEAFPSKKDEELFDLDFTDDDLAKESDMNKEKKSDITIEKEELFDFDLDSNNGLDLNLDELGVDTVAVENKPKSSPEIKEIQEIDVKSEEKIIEMPTKEVNKTEEKVEKVEKVETKILDQSEVLNIKDILENDEDSSLELDELMTPAVQMIRTSDETKKKEKKKKIKKVDDSSTLQADAVIDTLAALPVDTLKGLLAGATIKVSIKFPKVK